MQNLSSVNGTVDHELIPKISPSSTLLYSTITKANSIQGASMLVCCLSEQKNALLNVVLSAFAW